MKLKQIASNMTDMNKTEHVKGFGFILHNLSKDDKAFNVVQAYNEHLRDYKQIITGNTLAEKIAAERKWKVDAVILLLACKDKSNEVQS